MDNVLVCFFFSSRRRHTRLQGDWSSDVCSSDLVPDEQMAAIVKAMAAWGPMYADDFCTVIKTDGGGTLPIPTVDDTGKTAEATATEGATLTDDGGKDVEFGRKDLGDYMIDTEWLRLSIQFITGSYENAERLIADLLGERLGKKANAWLTTGTGTSQPQGIVTGSAAGKTLASIAAITSDELVDLVHSVDQEKVLDKLKLTEVCNKSKLILCQDYWHQVLEQHYKRHKTLLELV